MEYSVKEKVRSKQKINKKFFFQKYKKANTSNTKYKTAAKELDLLYTN